VASAIPFPAGFLLHRFSVLISHKVFFKYYFVNCLREGANKKGLLEGSSSNDLFCGIFGMSFDFSQHPLHFD
jgi:hypothetical protein